MKRFAIFLMMIVALFNVSSCNSEKTQNIFAFNTQISITLYDGSNDDIEYIEDLILKYDVLCNSYKSFESTNNVYTINHSDDYIEVDKKLYDLLYECYEFQLSDDSGLFNILSGKLNELWKQSIKNNCLPNDEDINKEVNIISNSTLLFEDNCNVKIEGLGQIDLGSVTKGYVLNRIAKYLEDNSIEHYLINAGTSSCIMGTKSNNDKFNVGIRNLDSIVYSFSNCALSTSSYDQQYAKIDGEIYSHIINPLTGSAKTIYDTVVVKGLNAFELDIFSTIFMMMSVQDIKIYEQAYDLEIIVIDDGDYIYESDTLKDEKSNTN